MSIFRKQKNTDMLKIFIRKFNTLIHHEHPFKLIIAEFLRKIGISMPLTIDRRYYKIKFYSTTYSRGFSGIPFDRQYDEDFFLSYLKKGDIVIDIGANIGELTLLSAALVKESGKVYSVEANIKTYNKYLLKNINLNGFNNIKTFCMACGNENSVAVLSDLKSDGANYIITSKVKKIRTVKTKLIKLDDLIPSIIEKINLLKIDTEGYELFVLKGAGNLLEKTDCIYYESCEDHYNRFNYQTKDVLSFLKDKYFSIFRIVAKEHVCQIKDMNNYVSQFENLIAVKDIEAFIKRTGWEVEG